MENLRNGELGISCDCIDRPCKYQDPLIETDLKNLKIQYQSQQRLYVKFVCTRDCNRYNEVVKWYFRNCLFGSLLLSFCYQI